MLVSSTEYVQSDGGACGSMVRFLCAVFSASALYFMFTCHYSWECDRLAKLNFCLRNLERDRTAFRPAVPALKRRINPAHQTSRYWNDAWHSHITIEALLLLRLCSVVHSERRHFPNEHWNFNGVISVLTYCCLSNFACLVEVLCMLTVQSSCPSVLYDVPARNLRT